MLQGRAIKWLQRPSPATSLAKRTQRVQWMQRVMTVLTSGPRFLSATERFISVNRPRSLPKCMDCTSHSHNSLLLLLSGDLTSSRAATTAAKSIQVSRSSREGDLLHSLRTVFKHHRYLLWACLGSANGVVGV